MRKSIDFIKYLLLLVMAVLMCISVRVRADADTYGDFEYLEEEDEYTYEKYAVITGYKGADTDVVIPNEISGITVTNIAYEAFSGCSNLTSITIPEGVTSIGSNAFSGCSSLTSITIPEGVRGIESGAFSGCTSLKSITIPKTVKSISITAFKGCKNLSKFYIDKDSVFYSTNKNFNVIYEKKGNKQIKLFWVADNVTSITIPDNVKSIGSYAFNGCTDLTSVTIPESVKSIGSYAFNGCSSLTSVMITESVKSIGSYAFNGCKNLTSITIPESVKNIGSCAFNGCAGLTSVTIPESVKSIEDSVFSNCTGLTSITIPDGVKSIRSYAFYGCTSLTSITIPESVKSIGRYAFYDCSSLTRITIPDSVTRFGDRLCRRAKIKDELGNETYTTIYCNKGSEAESYAVRWKIKCEYTSDITKPSSKITVEGITRKTCTGKECTQPKLVVKAGTKELESGTDYMVTYENNVNPGKATVKISGINDYQGTIKKTFAIILPKNATYVVGGMKYKVTNAATNGKGTLKVIGTTKTRSNRKFTSLTVNSTVTIGVVKYKVTAINAHAFKGYKNLKKIVNGHGLKTIGDKAFYGCSKLQSVTIKSSKITKFGKKTFSRIAAKPVLKMPKAVAKRYKKLLKSAGITSKEIFILTKK